MQRTLIRRTNAACNKRESLVLSPGSHQFPFSLAVPAASDSGAPMERSFNFPVRSRAPQSFCLLLPYLTHVCILQERSVRYELTARLVRVGIFNFDIARSHVLDFRRLPLPDDALIGSPSVSVSMRSSYIFGAQIEVRFLLIYRPICMYTITPVLVNRIGGNSPLRCKPLQYARTGAAARRSLWCARSCGLSRTLRLTVFIDTRGVEPEQLGGAVRGDESLLGEPHSGLQAVRCGSHTDAEVRHSYH